MTRPLAPGDVIHGFAHGAFGRDHYHCVRVEAVGPDWIVARDPDRDDEGHPSFTSGRQSLELCQDARDRPCPNDSPCPLSEEQAPLTSWLPQGTRDLSLSGAGKVVLSPGGVMCARCPWSKTGGSVEEQYVALAAHTCTGAICICTTGEVCPTCTSEEGTS